MWYNFSCKDSTEGLQDLYGPLIGWFKIRGAWPTCTSREVIWNGWLHSHVKQCHRFGRECLKFKDDGVNKSDGMLGEPIFWKSALPYIWEYRVPKMVKLPSINCLHLLTIFLPSLGGGYAVYSWNKPEGWLSLHGACPSWWSLHCGNF